MIVAKKEKKYIEIDLTGPNGNAFYLLAMVDRIGSQIGIPKEVRTDIKNLMTLGSYEDLLNTFDIWFGDYVIMYK